MHKHTLITPNSCHGLLDNTPSLVPIQIFPADWSKQTPAKDPAITPGKNRMYFLKLKFAQTETSLWTFPYFPFISLLVGTILNTDWCVSHAVQVEEYEASEEELEAQLVTGCQRCTAGFQAAFRFRALKGRCRAGCFLRLRCKALDLGYLVQCVLPSKKNVSTYLWGVSFSYIVQSQIHWFFEQYTLVTCWFIQLPPSSPQFVRKKTNR